MRNEQVARGCDLPRSCPRGLGGRHSAPHPQPPRQCDGLPRAARNCRGVCHAAELQPFSCRSACAESARPPAHWRCVAIPRARSPRIARPWVRPAGRPGRPRAGPVRVPCLCAAAAASTTRVRRACPRPETRRHGRAEPLYYPACTFSANSKPVYGGLPASVPDLNGQPAMR